MPVKATNFDIYQPNLKLAPLPIVKFDDQTLPSLGWMSIIGYTETEIRALLEHSPRSLPERCYCAVGYLQKCCRVTDARASPRRTKLI
ncbi:hypothetical protein CIB48_g8841 [Xylaria polymorpha]|nr:hypothetical protein CIB48_g8841 [Xylaria polymorpha]